jgi:hypothetical protein
MAHDQFVEAHHSEQMKKHTRIDSAGNPDQRERALWIRGKSMLNATNPGEAPRILEKQTWLQTSQNFSVCAH